RSDFRAQLCDRGAAGCMSLFRGRHHVSKVMSASATEDVLRARWLSAIGELGYAGASDDAVNAFVLRLGCPVYEAQVIVRRALQTLGLSTDDRSAPLRSRGSEGMQRL